MNDNWGVGTKALCEFFGISDETSRSWVKNGCPKLGHGQWDLKAVFDWWLENICQDQAEDSESLSEAKRLYWLSKAEGERLKVDQTKGLLVAWPDIEREWAGRLAELVNGLTTFADRLPPLLECRTRHEMRGIIAEEVYTLREAYGRTGKYCPPPATGRKN